MNKHGHPGPSPLEAQTMKLFRHIRTGSYKTRAGYKGKCLTFVRFCDQAFRLENIRNINDDHVVAYVLKRQGDQISDSTLCDDLSAIRFMMDHVSSPRYEISSNAILEESYDLLIAKAPLNPGNRAWTQAEYESFVQICENMNLQDPIDVSVLCKSMGLRITEAVAATRAQAEYALRTGEYQIKGEAKNGRWRKVQLSEDAKRMFARRIIDVPRGGHLFIKPGEKTHLTVNEFEQFLRRVRDRFQTEDGIRARTYKKSGKSFANDITWHGLRYIYAQSSMQELIKAGYSFNTAKQIVSLNLGHNRLPVVDIYIGENGRYLNGIQ